MSDEREPEHDDHPGEHATPPAQRGAEDFGADWVDPDDAAEEMAEETEGRS